MSCVKSVYCVFQGSVKDISRKFQVCFNGVSSGREFQGCFKEVSRVIHGSLMCFSGKFQWYFKKNFKVVSRKFQGCFKEFSIMFQ